MFIKGGNIMDSKTEITDVCAIQEKERLLDESRSTFEEGDIPSPNDQIEGGYKFVRPPEKPTQFGPYGIRFDFNEGARLWLPEGRWFVRLTDDESDLLLFQGESLGGWIVSAKKYWVRFRWRVWRIGEELPCLDHVISLKNKTVIISFPGKSLGDHMGWISYAGKFQEKHLCRTEVLLDQPFIDILEAQYPELTMNTTKDVSSTEPYATYRVGLWFGGGEDNQPVDFRQCGLVRAAGYILGVDPTELRPRFKLDAPRTIDEPYVCIATKASGQVKMWNNPFGWAELIRHLKARGYRVLCIDKDAIYGEGLIWNHIPHGAEDYTGAHPLQERIDLLMHADFFIGPSSGLAWVAWGCNIPVLLIAGFTMPTCEFYTPWRVQNTHGCYGCWDDMGEQFKHNEYVWCPRHKGTPREAECTKLITGQQVIRMADRLAESLMIKAGKQC